MTLITKRKSLAAIISMAMVGMAVVFLSWSSQREDSESGQVDLSQKQPGRSLESQDSVVVSTLSSGSPDSSAIRESPLKYSLYSLPSEYGGGVRLSIGIDEATDEFPKNSDVRAVTVIGICPSAWNAIRPLSKLESLELYGEVTDEDLTCLASFPHLKRLRVVSDIHRSGGASWPGRRLPFSAVGLKPLSKLNQLRELSISSDSLNDAGIDILTTVPELLSLKLDGFFTNETLTHVGNLQNLQRLSLTGDFDDEGIRHLKRLVNLECLELRSSNLHGPGLATLSSLPLLRCLRVGQAASDLSLNELVWLVAKVMQQMMLTQFLEMRITCSSWMSERILPTKCDCVQ